MNRKKNKIDSACSCETFETLLSDYADGELDVAATTAMREHLETCAACRVQVATLRRSLAVARSIWQESAESAIERTVTRAPEVQRQAPSSARRRSLRWPQAAAVVLMLATVTCWAWYASRSHEIADRFAPGDDRQELRAEVDGGHVQQEATGLPLDDESIDALIRRQEQAARLATAIEIMASMPELDSDVARARKYLESTYGSESLSTQPNHPLFTEGS